MSVKLRIETQQVNAPSGEVTVVQFTDRKIIEQAQIDEIGEELFSLVDEEKKTNLLLNFQRVEFMSSSALNKLINLHHKVTAMDGNLKLSNVSKDIMDVFRITRLERLLDIQKDQATALASF